MDSEREHVVLDEARPECPQVGRRRRTAVPRARVVGEDLEARCPDRSGAVDGLHHAAREGEVHSNSAVGQGRKGFWLHGPMVAAHGFDIHRIAR